MTISLSENHVRFLHLRAQKLMPQPPNAVTDVAQLVQEMCGIQAQDARATTLAVRPRSTGLIAADVEHARVQERSVVRTWGQRGTLHLLATEDLGWLLPLFGPVFIAASRRRRAELGLDEDTCARGIRIIRDTLGAQGPLTRAELVQQLAIAGIRLEGQARPHLLYRAALEGVICFGPDRGTEPTYVLLSDWVNLGQGAYVERSLRRGGGGVEQGGDPWVALVPEWRHSLSQEAAYTELARRYLQAYGPATPEDLAAWSGMPMSKIRTAWQHIVDQLIEVEVVGSPAWMLKSCAAWLDEPLASTPVVRLLPSFDIYLLGYQHRQLVVPLQHAKRINAGGGLIHPTLMVDGRAVGTWKSKRQKDHLDVVVEPFDQLAPEVLPLLEAEVADLARFLGVRGAYVERNAVEPT